MAIVSRTSELFPELDEIYWGATFWADGFFVRSAGVIEDKVISAYVKKQR
jgi:REP element-mobilizing transposase RayT